MDPANDAPASPPGTLLLETRGAVRLLTLNRPGKLNAMDTAMIEGLVHALQAAEADDAVGAIVIAGAGRGFSAGADTSEFRDIAPAERHRVERRSALTASLQELLPGLGRPVLAATHGHVLGGGCALALACDMVVAAESSRFGYPEVKRGILASSVTPNLARQVGTKAAFELLLTGRSIGPVRALELGLVNRIVPDGTQVEAAVALAAELAALPAPALRATKRLFYRTLDVDLARAMQLAHEAHGALRAAGPARSA
ncbi:MAG: enoyl-CoA hydratase/isomerase family protein [Betaproteobacteria bacterium]|jgi:enoyl-CoA hydratase/carnithine racemase|nr:enoyl-CoA hydratase/isomerase family protein [Betaproteobacteria bacterium]